MWKTDTMLKENYTTGCYESQHTPPKKSKQLGRETPPFSVINNWKDGQIQSLKLKARE